MTSPDNPTPAEDLATGASGQSVWLDSFFTALAGSLVSARKVLRDQHVADVVDHWELVPNTEGLRKAKAIRLQVVPDQEDGRLGKALDVPTAALVQHNSLVLDSLTVDLECTVTGFDAHAPGGKGRIAIRLDNSGEGGVPMRLNLQFKYTDAPEGVARIGDFAVRCMI